MANLADVIEYLLKEYPHKDEISTARLTKMVFLADWKHCIEHGRQLSNIQWFFDDYGPFVWDVKDEVEKHPSRFRISMTTNFYGDPKRLFKLASESHSLDLTKEEVATLYHVVDSTKDLSWSGFMRLVYDTYPVAASERYSFLELADLAKKYRSRQQSASERQAD